MPRLRGPLLLALAAVLSAGSALAQPGTIEEIHVQGLFRMTEAGFRHALELSEGDPYDVNVIRRKFRKLWDMALFEEITIEAEDAPLGGKVVVIKVKERPVLSSVVYEENKIVTQTQIEDALKERDIRLGLGKPVDLRAIADTAGVIRDLLALRGFMGSKVDYEVEELTATALTVRYSIKPGRKTRIKKIDFTGNEVFKDRTLKSQLKLTQARKWYWPFSKKNLYHPIKWDQDVGEIRDLYQRSGYLDVELRGPVVELKEIKKKKRHEKKAEKPPVPERLVRRLERCQERLERDDLGPDRQRKLRKRKRKLESKVDKKLAKSRKAGAAGRQWAYLTVPVVEGRQYKMGKLTVEGNAVLTEKQLTSLVPLREGMILNEGLLKLGVNTITRAYEDRGHLYANVVRRINRHEDEPVADVEIQIDEDRPHRIERIEFNGNTSTKDNVLRREVQLSEGDLFSRTKLDLSRIKLNQLGYFTVQDEPVIEPVEGRDEVKINFGGQEQGRNEIQVGGGYSGLDGAFFNGIYSTRNFLGRGQVVQLALQVGGRADRYSISFTEPWFLNRPWTAGFRLFRSDVDFTGSFRSTSKGGGLVLGRRLGPFRSFTVNYAYESVSSTTVDITGNLLGSASNRISSIAPSYRYNRINNPYRPSRGSEFAITTQIAGGVLGGDTAFYKPILDYTTYRKASRRSFFGFHIQGGMVRECCGGSTQSNSNINGIPRFQRFWLGGDTLGPRVFETRSITPLRYLRLDAAGNIIDVISDPTGLSNDELAPVGGVPTEIEVGGDRFVLMQTELVRPLNEQVELALFFDAGDSFYEDSSLGFETFRLSAGVELRLHLPVFPVPLRLIYGWPVRKLEEDRTSSFQFSIGRSF